MRRWENEGGWMMRNRLRKWSRGSYTAQCLRRSLAEHTPPAEDEIVWGVTCKDCAAQEGVWSGQKGNSGSQGLPSLNSDWWWTKHIQAKTLLGMVSRDRRKLWNSWREISSRPSGFKTCAEEITKAMQNTLKALDRVERVMLTLKTLNICNQKK